MATEGFELGVFPSAADARVFAAGYLADGREFADLTVPRAVRTSVAKG